jgi:hypothetical protein
MLNQRVTMAKVMVGFKTNQRNALVLIGQINQLLDWNFLLR